MLQKPLLKPVDELEALSLRLPLLVDAVKFGQVAQANLQYSETYPIVGKGNHRWASTVSFLHHHLKAAGWTLTSQQNLPLAISPDGKHVLMVATGNSETGDPSDAAEVDFQHARGRTTERVLHRQAQLALFAEYPEPALIIFLFRVTRRAIEIELSMPASVVEGRVLAWRWRLPLPTVDLKKKTRAKKKGEEVATIDKISGSEKDPPPARGPLARKKQKGS